ncbi:MAG: ABC transporter ATP-binding protein [Turicibacter sp.]
MIEVKNISKKYGSKAVVNNVSFQIKRGKITSFIGPNGAGKSTVLGMMSRLLKKDSGEVFIDGKEISKWDTKELSKVMGILKQSNHLNVRLTIRDLVAFGRFPHSQGNLTAEDQVKIDEALAYMQLEDIQHKFLDELSGGQRQRAFIGMVLAQDTDYIFLDEPLNNLDMKHSVQIMKMLRRITDELGKTVVIVIHDINFASCYSDEIIALQDGEIAVTGTVDEIMQASTLSKLYDMEFNVQEINDKKICVYY